MLPRIRLRTLFWIWSSWIRSKSNSVSLSAFGLQSFHSHFGILYDIPRMVPVVNIYAC